MFKSRLISSIKTLPLLFGLLFIASSLNAQPNEDCLVCHSDNELTMDKGGKEISLFVNETKYSTSAHSKLQCVSCHKGFDPESIPHKENIERISCLTCHQNAPTKHLFHPQIIKTSGKSNSPDVRCSGCHGVHDVIPLDSPGSKWSSNKLAESCGYCHGDVATAYLPSEHHEAYEKNVLGSPNCLTCHKNPIVTLNGDVDSLDVKVSQEKLCLSCHLDDSDIRSRTAPSAGFITLYEQSVHGSALIGGNEKAANCVDCHNSHKVLNGSNSTSSVNKLNIATTCSQCHSDISNEYQESVHGLSVADGNHDSPTCTDCHGEHNILRHDDPESPVSFFNVSDDICQPCHTSLKLSEKYGITTNRFKTFSDSYHGLALKGGSLAVANCASCHGVHNIKPSTDPTSPIHKDNLVKTCGKCHPGADETFTQGKVHVTLEKADSPILYYISTIYIALIVSVIGFMLIHNLIDFIKKSKIKKMKQRGRIEEIHHGHALYLRMTLNERIQHAVMAGSFIILVITGFMLRFPESWWVIHIKDVSSHAFEARSLIHRIAAVLMVAVSLYHIYYIAFTKRGRQLVKDLFPKIQDLRDAIGIAKFNLGISKTKPKLDRFSYIEKAEYWALVWGTIVMTLTGLLMWIYDEYTGSFSKFEWDVARTIHYFEAWLAFLAIVVWHFYFVIFNPDVYPMSLAWLKGTISEEEMAEEHPLEYERIKKSEMNIGDDSFSDTKD